MSKKYDVYGIGNALVDMEFEVAPEFLKKMGVDKGLMTLVDESRQQELLDHLKGVQHKRSCGGSAANTVIAVSQLGGRSFYSCKVANDEMGDFYHHDLQKNGVKTNLSERGPGQTGRCMVFITPDADRTMNTFLGITSQYSTGELVPEELKNSQWLYIEGYLSTSSNGTNAALKAKEIAKEFGVKTALTFSDPGVVSYFREAFEKIIEGKVDLLFCNEAEALAFSKTNNLDEAKEILKVYAHSYAITRGAEGASLYQNGIHYEILANEVEAIDTNGAGDLFAGAFLYGITQGRSFAEAGRLACKAASLLVTQFGARLSLEQAKGLL